MKGDSSPFDFSAQSRASDSANCGVLCIHGFTGTPWEMRYLGQQLSERGFRALGPALPGHVTSPRDMALTTWRDWYRAAEQALDKLRAECDQVAVVGLSMGGLLALRLAQHRGDHFKAVASLSAPLWFQGLTKAAVRATRDGTVLRRLVRFVPKLGGADALNGAVRRANPGYRLVSVDALHQLVDLMGVVDRDLAKVTLPALIMHGRKDHTAPYACSEHIAAQIRSEVAIHRALDRSFHQIPNDVERDVVADTVGDFFAEQFDL